MIKLYIPKHLKAISWSISSKIGVQSLNFISQIYIANLLSPEEFGLFAILLIVSNFTLLFKDLGLTRALIYNDFHETSDTIHTVFFINLFFGLFLTGIILIASPFISTFFSNEDLIPMLMAYSITILLTTIGGVHKAQLIKSLKFKSIAVIDNISNLIVIVVSIKLAISGFGIWSLIVGGILRSILMTTMTIFTSSYKLKIIFQPKTIIPIMRYSISTSLNTITNYFMRNSDNFMIGKFLNNTSLGVYNFAYRIVFVPITNISGAIKDVLFPSFSSIKKDKIKLSDAYCGTIQSVALISIPIYIMLSISSENFVYIFLGDKWNSMIEVLSILSLIAIPQTIFTFNGTIFNSIGKPQIPLRINLISLPFYIIGFYLGLKINGLMGLIYAYGTVFIFALIPNIIAVHRQLGLSYSIYLELSRPLILGIVLLITSMLLLNRLAMDSRILHFFLVNFTGLICYTTMIVLNRKRLIIYNKLVVQP